MSRTRGPARSFDELADRVRAQPGAEAEIAAERRRALAEIDAEAEVGSNDPSV